MSYRVCNLGQQQVPFSQVQRARNERVQKELEAEFACKRALTHEGEASFWRGQYAASGIFWKDPEMKRRADEAARKAAEEEKRCDWLRGMVAEIDRWLASIMPSVQMDIERERPTPPPIPTPPTLPPFDVSQRPMVPSIDPRFAQPPAPLPAPVEVVPSGGTGGQGLLPPAGMPVATWGPGGAMSRREAEAAVATVPTYQRPGFPGLPGGLFAPSGPMQATAFGMGRRDRLGQSPLILGPSSWGAGLVAPPRPVYIKPVEVPPYWGEWAVVDEETGRYIAGCDRVGPFETSDEAFAAAAKAASDAGAKRMPLDGFAQVKDSRGTSVGPII